MSIDLFALTSGQSPFIARTQWFPNPPAPTPELPFAPWWVWTNVSTEIAASNPGPILYFGSVLDAAVARSLRGASQGVLHLCFINELGYLWYSFRRPDGYWSNVEDATLTMYPPPTQPPRIESLAVAAVNEDLEICAVTPTGGLLHTIRMANGSWQPQGFGDVLAVVGAVPGSVAPNGPIADVSCASLFGELHVVALTSSSHPQILHTIRHADGAWNGFEDLFSIFVQGGWNWPQIGNVGPPINSSIYALAIAEHLEVLHICFAASLSFPEPVGVYSTVFHFMKYPQWQWHWVFTADVLSLASAIYGPPPVNIVLPVQTGSFLSLASDSTYLHLAYPALTIGSPIIHSKYFPLSTWDKFDQVPYAGSALGGVTLNNSDRISMAGSV